MKYKSGQIFWGLVFLTVGSLFLLVKYDVINDDFGFIWDLWPIALILIGLQVITKDSIARPIVNAVFGVFMGVIAFGSLYNTFDFVTMNIDYDDDDDYYSVEKFSEPYDRDIEYADLYLNAGVGSCIIKRSTRDLVRGVAKGTELYYYFNTDKSDDKAEVFFELNKKNFNLLDGKIRNRLEIQLNKNPVWGLDLEIGAAKSWFDLSDYKVRKVKLQTGATNTRLKLGDKYDETEVDVEMGAASLEIQVPYTSGCKLIGEMVLMDKNFDGFIKKDSDYYITENFSEADKKIIIDLSGAVSSIKIRRY